MHQQPLQINNEQISFHDICHFLSGEQQVTIADEALAKVKKCRNYLDEKMASSDQLIYGINTGFGFLQDVRIDHQQLEQLQRNLLVSHACGLGEEVPVPIIRLMMLLKIKSLSYGNSGVQTETVKRLIDMINHQVYPVVYTQGSLGASGDLAPLSHLSLPLIGEGEVYFRGTKMPAMQALQQLGWEPVSLKSKEGLALINGTQFMTGYGLFLLAHGTRLMEWAQIISAISFDAFDCVPDPLNEHIHAVRPHAGQVDTAKKLRNLLEGSDILKQKKSQVQDAYSFRCIPQVHGASMDTIEYVRSVFIREINAVTDNPNIFPDDDLMLSGGNFHGQPLALALDFLCIALHELGSISERRTFQLISGQRGLPLFLVKNPGLHSGFMIPQYTAASIVSESKQLCTPASIDSIPSSNNQEDHVSMGANAATKCKRVLDNLEKVLAIELFTCVQAMEFRRPLQTSPKLEKIIADYRETVSFNDADRILHHDMVNSVRFLQENDGWKS